MALVPEGPPKLCRGCGITKPRSEFYARRLAGRVYAQSRCKHCMRTRPGNAEYTARYRKRIQADPEALAIYRDKQRERERARRGTPPERYRLRLAPAATPCPSMDTAPFAAWLNTLGPDAAAIARACGMKERHVRRILNGETTTVTLDTVDAALLAADTLTTLDDLLPLEEAA